MGRWLSTNVYSKKGPRKATAKPRRYYKCANNASTMSNKITPTRLTNIPSEKETDPLSRKIYLADSLC